MIKNKRAEGHIGTCIMIFICCISIAVFSSLLLAVNTARISKRNTYKIIDGYVTKKSIEAFNAIKVGTDYIESFDEDDFINYFCEYNGMQENGNILIAKTDTGAEKYRVTNLNMTFIEDKTLKLKVEYVITIPISFGDFNVMYAEVPVTIKSKLTNKFGGT